MNGEARSETLFSVLTPTGRGAVAVVAVQGPQAVQAIDGCFLAKNRRPLADQLIGRIAYGHWRAADGEDLIVCRCDVEHVEIHCHGGSQSVATIVSDLSTAGIREIAWQEWLSRQGDYSLKVEAQFALSQATSLRTATVLLDQFHGSLEQELTAIRELIATDAVAAQQRLVTLLSTAELGMHLTRPWQVVIAGKPNVGKSSLINALVGYQRAIVFDQPGTTRDVVTASTVIDGWPVVLSDTAGLHDSTDELESAGINLARERLATADLVVWVSDASNFEDSWQTLVAHEATELQLSLPKKCLFVLNKIDRMNEKFAVPQDVIATSATRGAGIEELLTAISTSLVPNVPTRGAAVLFTERQRVAVVDMLQGCRQGNVRGAMEILSSLLNRVVSGE